MSMIPKLPKISNPFEDETDFIDQTDPADVAKQAGQNAANAAMKQVVKPVVTKVGDDTTQSIVDFLYGAGDSAPAPMDSTPAGGAPDAGIEQLAQGQGQVNPQQAAKLQQIADPDQKMTSADKAQLSEEQLEQREKNRLHIRNYFTVGNKLDDIGQLEEQIAKVRQMKQQEEEEKKREEEEEKERKKQEEEEKKQQLAPPSGKKTGVPTHVQREQNKTENKTGFSG